MAGFLLAPLRADLVRWSGCERSVQLADSDAAYEKLPPYARARFVLVDGTLWKAASRCVYRRDEVTAWALLQLLERYPDLPDFDVVLNCRDGPLLRPPRRGSSWSGSPLVLSFSAMAEHAEVATPDYTFWGLPGKLKPWSALRVDLLHRAKRPWARRVPRAIATGVVNDYHSTLGVKTRQAVLACNARADADRRFEIHYHSLYFARYYSTEEHCAYKYILLAPGSHAVWLDHMKQKLLCGSLVMLLEPAHTGRARQALQYDVLTRLLRPGVHYLSIPLPPPELSTSAASAKAAAPKPPPICQALSDALDWAEANPQAAQQIADAGRALVRDVLTMGSVYAYMAEVLNASSRLLSYPPGEAMRRHRMIADPNPKRGSQWFNASNFSRVPTDPDTFARWIRNDTSYPVHSQIREADFEAVVIRHDFSTMGVDFAASARKHRAEVEEIRRQQQAADAAKRRAEDDDGRRRGAEIADAAAPRGGRRGRRRRRGGRARGGSS